MSEEIDFLSYSEKRVSEDTKDKLRTLVAKYPNIKEELFNHTKNAMMATIFDENQSKEYIEGVKDTLKLMSRFF